MCVAKAERGRSLPPAVPASCHAPRIRCRDGKKISRNTIALPRALVCVKIQRVKRLAVPPSHLHTPVPVPPPRLNARSEILPRPATTPLSPVERGAQRSNTRVRLSGFRSSPEPTKRKVETCECYHGNSAPTHAWISLKICRRCQCAGQSSSAEKKIVPGTPQYGWSSSRCTRLIVGRVTRPVIRGFESVYVFV